MQPDASTATRRRCVACGHAALDPAPVCPRCGQRLLTPRTVRRLGWVLVVIGAGLVSVMSALLLWLHRVVNQPSPAARFTGTPEDAATAYLILGLVLAFGLVAVAAGLWQVLSGRRHRFLPALAVAIVVLVEVIYVTLRWLGR